MKLIVRSAIGFLFLLAMAMPSLAQNPDVAVRILPPAATDGCFRYTVKNLRPTVITVNVAYISIFDQGTCKLTCDSKIKVGTKIKPCETYTFKICCPKPLPSKHIVNVRINHSLGNNEQWYFRP